MFMGEYSHTIDTKGRLIIPSKFREELGETFVVTKGLDGCLFVFSDEEWKAFEIKLKSLPLTNKNARQFARFFVAGATPCELDIMKNGNYHLPNKNATVCPFSWRCDAPVNWTTRIYRQRKRICRSGKRCSADRYAEQNRDLEQRKVE